MEREGCSYMTPHGICTFAVVTSLGLLFGCGTHAPWQQKSFSNTEILNTKCKEHKNTIYNENQDILDAWTVEPLIVSP